MVLSWLFPAARHGEAAHLRSGVSLLLPPHGFVIVVIVVIVFVFFCWSLDDIDVVLFSVHQNDIDFQWALELWNGDETSNLHFLKKKMCLLFSFAGNHFDIDFARPLWHWRLSGTWNLHLFSNSFLQFTIFCCREYAGATQVPIGGTLRQTEGNRVEWTGIVNNIIIIIVWAECTSNFQCTGGELLRCRIWLRLFVIWSSSR